MPGNRKQLQKQERERKCLNFLFARHLSSVISTEDMGNKHEYIRCNRDQKSQWYTAARWEAILCYSGEVACQLLSNNFFSTQIIFQVWDPYKTALRVQIKIYSTHWRLPNAPVVRFFLPFLQHSSTCSILYHRRVDFLRPLWKSVLTFSKFFLITVGGQDLQSIAVQIYGYKQ